MIHRSSLTMEAKKALDFSAGRRVTGFLLLFPNKIEDFLLSGS
jgi:hypothetical protein